VPLTAFVGWHHYSCTSPSATEETDGPDKAFEWRRLAWLDETGNLAPDAFKKAVEQRDRNLEFWKAHPDNDPSEAISWTERGPNNIGGRSRSILVDPTTPSTLLAGSVGGGIWRSTDSGATWARVDDRLGSLAIGCLTRDPNNANVIYAGTGEGFFNGDAIGGVGIYKSVDRGLTWSLMQGTTGFGNVCRIAVAPGNSNLIMVSARYGGLYRSTDGGANFTSVYWAQGSYFVAFNPTDSTKLIAQVIDYDFGTSQWFHAALYSTNSGATWTASATGLNRVNDFGSRIELAYAPSNPSIVYANCAASGGQIWKSTDGGVNYTMVTTSGSIGSSWYACPIWVNPQNANFVVAGGTYFYRSTNGGVTLTKISNGYIDTSQAHPDTHAIVSDPGFNNSSNKKVYYCTDGGVYYTADVSTASTSTGWTRKDQSYRATQFYGAAGNGATGRIVGGTQDNGQLTLQSSASTNALLTFGGDGGFAAMDPTDQNYIYGEYIDLQIHRSTNGGTSASYIYTGISDAGSAANFIAPFILDPNNVNRMLAGGASLWRSNNVKAATPTWTSIKAAGTDYISAIAVAPGNSDIIWVAQNDGKVFKTANGTAASPTWTTVDDNSATNPIPNRYVTRIVIDPSNSNTVFIALGGFSPDNLLKTTNGGTSFSDITGSAVTGLPDAPIRGFARHPNVSTRLYAGTEVGFFTSADGGLTWSTSAFGPANVSVDECVFMHNSQSILLATHGRGMWTADQSNPAGLFKVQVALQGYVPSVSTQPMTITILQAGTETVLTQKIVNPGVTGLCSMDPEVPAGTYDVRIKASHWLSKRLNGLAFGTGGYTVGTIQTLKNGDCAPDNIVDLGDFDTFALAFGSSVGDANYSAMADLTGDTNVDLGDFDLLALNFGQSGD